MLFMAEEVLDLEAPIAGTRDSTPYDKRMDAVINAKRRGNQTHLGRT